MAKPFGDRPMLAADPLSDVDFNASTQLVINADGELVVASDTSDFALDLSEDDVIDSVAEPPPPLRQPAASPGAPSHVVRAAPIAQSAAAPAPQAHAPVARAAAPAPQAQGPVARPAASPASQAPAPVARAAVAPTQAPPPVAQAPAQVARPVAPPVTQDLIAPEPRSQRPVAPAPEPRSQPPVARASVVPAPVARPASPVVRAAVITMSNPRLSSTTATVTPVAPTTIGSDEASIAPERVAPRRTPSVLGRAIRERDRRSDGTKTSDESGRGRTRGARGETFFQRGREALDAGDLTSAERDLAMALTYAPGEVRYRQAFEELKRLKGR